MSAIKTHLPEFKEYGEKESPQATANSTED